MPKSPYILISLEEVLRIIKKIEEADAKHANDLASAIRRGEIWANIDKERLNARAELLMQFTEQINRLHKVYK
jgi:hypothetical protein